MIEDSYGNTHTLRDVWYVPDLNDSIVSKHWTKHSGLRTTMDEHENFQFYSTEPNNPFHMSTITIDKMSIISNIKVEHVVVILAIAYEKTTTMHLGASLEIPMHGALAVKGQVTLQTTAIEDIKSPSLHPAFRTGAPINKVKSFLRAEPWEKGNSVFCDRKNVEGR